MIIKLADLNIKIDNKYKYIADMCAGYITPETDFEIDASVTEREISAEDSGGFASDYLESLAVYRKIAERLPKYNGFLMHGAVIEYGDCGIAFLAKSGMGKSTHISLWQELFKDKIKIINGDKPIVRIIGDTAYAFGTPWAGKEHMHSNAKTVLKKICFIERAPENKCVKIEKTDILARLIPQVYIPKNGCVPQILELIGRVIAQADFYVMRCNKDVSAAAEAHEIMLNAELHRPTEPHRTNQSRL